jgi:predicted NAD/FAD-binding protein
VAVLRQPNGVSLRASGRWIRHDKVVIATHADQALDLLADSSPEEKAVLGAFAYTRNDTLLHTDTRLLPEATNARASWNYLTPAGPDADRPALVTYWLNRLQGLETPDQYLVTLNGRDRIHPDKVIASMTYEHPVYDLAAVRAQQRLAGLATDTTAFAGAYHGWGFHEDGCRSGVAAARAFGVAW